MVRNDIAKDMYEDGTLLSLAYPLPKSLSNLNGFDDLQVLFLI